uniref:Uncharacterized protein n=1 Tax=Anguilla anguilla TaxID=7936 RepID=A0A0E9X277_ANGAN
MNCPCELPWKQIVLPLILEEMWPLASISLNGSSNFETSGDWPFQHPHPTPTQLYPCRTCFVSVLVELGCMTV